MSDLANFYDNDFYRDQIEGSYRSAKRYASILGEVWQPASVVDLGCGRGAWLKAFRERGAVRVMGLDGPWNAQDKMIDPEIEFRPVDFNETLNAADLAKFDLAISLEVAEHLEEAVARNFVASLANLSDNVLFGAAFSGQGGTNHVNEQPHSYWAAHFDALGYEPFDLFRPLVWGDDEIEFWYRQNTFLYVRTGAPLHAKLVEVGMRAVPHSFMNCVHPMMYERRLAPPTFKASLRYMVDAIVR